MKNLTWQNPEQLFVAQELINKVKSKCCGIKDELKQIGDKRRRRKGKTGKSYLFSNKIVFSCRDKPGCGVFIYVTPIIEEQN